MSEWIRIRVKDFYKDAVGELEYTYVTREVYEALVDTFRKEAHAQEMRDIRHTTKDGYTEGETEDLVELTGESVEDTVIRQMEIETLQKAMQSLTPVQRERLHFYFFEGMTYRQIGASSDTAFFENHRSTIRFQGHRIATCLYRTPMGSCIEKTVAFYIPHNLKIIKYAQRSLLPSPGANERCFFCLQRKEASVKWQYFG